MAAEKSMGAELKNTTDEVVIGGLTSIGEIGMESEEIDVTSLDASDGYRDFIAGLKDGGEVALEGFVKSNAQIVTILAWAEAQTEKNWQVAFSSGAAWDFPAFVKSYKEGEASVDSARTFKVVLRVTGQPTFDDNLSV